VPKFIQFKGSKYQQASGNTFLKTVLDKGNNGEFLTFSKLEKLTGYFKLMTNLYLPKKDGSTTEIDLIMLSETGIYVFESKNYSGWIFGDEKNKNWMQTLPNKQKEKFFNPILQNKTHINALKSVLGKDDEKLFKSYIIFSERCTLKKINVTSTNVKVIKRNALIPTIKREISNNVKMLTHHEIERLYLQLNKYSHADVALKKAHIKQIQMIK
jgi:hypothetical protein